VPERGKKLCDVVTVAGRAGNLLPAKDEDLKISIAINAMEFENRHFKISS